MGKNNFIAKRDSVHFLETENAMINQYDILMITFDVGSGVDKKKKGDDGGEKKVVTKKITKRWLGNTKKKGGGTIYTRDNIVF